MVDKTDVTGKKLPSYRKQNGKFFTIESHGPIGIQTLTVRGTLIVKCGHIKYLEAYNGNVRSCSSFNNVSKSKPI